MTNLWQRARFRLDHRWAPTHMSDYLDDQLVARARARVQRHVRDCPECRGILLGLQRMLGALHALPPLSARERPDIASAVRRRLA